MKAVMLGATRGMGRAVAREIARRGDTLFLLGRDSADLAASARDLELRGAAGPVHTAIADLLDPAGFVGALDAADDALGGFDTAIVSAALFDLQDRLEVDRQATARLLAANFSGTILFAEEVRVRLLDRGGGRLCVFGSVAGDRARKPVVLYGASKAGLAYYLDGLDLRFRDSGLRVLTVKPGFVRTSMTAGLPVPPFAGEPEAVARTVLRALDRGSRQVYAPAAWGLIMAVIRRLPRAILRRVGF